MSNTLSHHIATLLRRHDCVIVPGIGAFVCTREPAMFSGELLTPPRKVVSFNPALTHDDGLLAGSYARRMKISFEQARERVSAESALVRRRLNAEGAVDFARIGTLHLHADERLEFLPEIAWSLVLPAIRATAPTSVFEVLKPASDEPDKAVAVVKVPFRLHWLRAAAAAVVLCVLGFALSTPINLKQAQNASLAAPMFTPPEPVYFENLPEPEHLELNLAMAPASGSLSTVKPAPERPKPYVVVVASLPSRSKAQEFIASSGISSLNILQSGDKFRVYAAAGESPQQARDAANALTGFSSRFPDSWVCRR